VVIDKRNAEKTILDIAVPGDYRVKNIIRDVSQDLALKLTRLWKTSTKVIPM